MNSIQEWPAVLRLVWLTGGVVAVNEPAQAEVCIKSNVAGRTFATFTTNSYPEIFSALRSLGFRIVGTTFITDPKQLEGLRAPEFRAAGLSGGWPVWDTRHKWRQIAYASSRNRNLRLMDVAARISAALQYSEMRLHDLANSYSTQLHGRLHSDEPKAYVAFKDTYSSAVYKDIHSMFWEMAVLRNVLAEFIAVFCLGRENITGLSGLLKSLKKNPSPDCFAEEVQRIANCDSAEGWLGRFGSYRDCFTHSAPMSLARGAAFTIQDELVLKDSSSVPQIYYPLPGRPDGLMRDRSQGVSFDPLTLRPGEQPRRDRTEEPDALEYLHSRLCQLTDLATRLVPRSPVAPQPILVPKHGLVEKQK